MKTRIFAFVLAAVMAFGLMACSAPAAEVTPTPSVAPSAAPSAAPSLEVDLTQDIITFSAGISPDEVMLTVNGEEVSAATYLYWLIRNCSYYAAYGLIWPIFYTAVFYLAYVGILTLLFGYFEKKLSYYKV